MPTNPIPQGSCNLAINMPLEMRSALGRLAIESNMSIGEYIRRLITPAVQNGVILSKNIARVCVVGIVLLGFGSLIAYSLTAHDNLIRTRTAVRVVARGRREWA